MFHRKTICKHAGCGKVVQIHEGLYCAEHRRYVRSDVLASNDSRAKSKEKRTKNPLYNHRWEKSRKAHLMVNPLCVQCKAAGKIVMAKVVDHIVPHGDDLGLFWDMNNWQSLCTRCHAMKSNEERRRKYAEEKTGLQRIS